jgi:hypothetical protein
MENAGKMKWKLTVKANCSRARRRASKSVGIAGRGFRAAGARM